MFIKILLTGTYDDCVGTNVFFEENEESTSQTDIFSKKTPINLNYVTKQFKVLNMQWAKLPEDASADVVDDYDIKFKENYEVTLKKLDKGKFWPVLTCKYKENFQTYSKWKTLLR